MAMYDYVSGNETAELASLETTDRARRQLELDMRRFLIGPTSCSNADRLVASIFAVTSHEEIARAMVEFGARYLASLQVK